MSKNKKSKAKNNYKHYDNKAIVKKTNSQKVKADLVDNYQKFMGNYKQQGFKCDYHIHSEKSFDGFDSFRSIVAEAERKDVMFIAVADHNSIEIAKNIIETRGYPADKVLCEVGTNVYLVPAVEVTCMIDLGVKRHNIHIGVYAPDLSNEKFVELISNKNRNDYNYDYYYFHAIEACTELRFTKDEIRKLYEHKKQKDKRFDGFKKKEVIEYCINTRKQLYDGNEKKLANKLNYILKHADNPKRLIIDAEQLIKVANEAGAVCVLMHPNSKAESQQQLDLIREKLYKAGLYGEEGMYGSQKTMNKYTQDINNIVSGGSDTHNLLTKPMAKVGKDYLYADNFKLTNKLIELEKQREQLRRETGVVKQLINIDSKIDNETSINNFKDIIDSYKQKEKFIDAMQQQDEEDELYSLISKSNNKKHTPRLNQDFYNIVEELKDERIAIEEDILSKYKRMQTSKKKELINKQNLQRKKDTEYER